MEPITKNDLLGACSALIVGFVLLSMLVAMHNQRCHDKEMIVLKEINVKIDKREVLDSAYRDHLKDCSYIKQSNLYVNNQGYVKSHYKCGYAPAQK